MGDTALNVSVTRDLTRPLPLLTGHHKQAAQNYIYYLFISWITSQCIVSDLTSCLLSSSNLNPYSAEIFCIKHGNKKKKKKNL